MGDRQIGFSLFNFKFRIADPYYVDFIIDDINISSTDKRLLEWP